MGKQNKFNIEEFLSLDGYANDARTNRRSGSGGSQEFFTNYVLVKKMCDKISLEKWNDPNANFLEPSAGNGQFVVYIIYNKIKHGSTWEQALSHTWSVDLMEDNVRESKQRVLNMFDEMEIEYNRTEAMKIMDHNLVCSDFFKWDFENWCPIKESEDPQSFSLF